MNAFVFKRRMATALFLGAGLFAASCATPPAAQDTAEKKFCIGCSVDGKTTPRAADGHPDLNGFWVAGGGGGGESDRVFQRLEDGSILYDTGTEFNVRELCKDPVSGVEDTCQNANQPSYKPEYFDKVKAIAATMYRGTTPLDPMMDCRPHGIPRAGVGNMQIVQTPQAIAILYSAAPSSIWRIIYTDGRPHPADLETSFMGDSIGRWEGDTLVVDVTGLSDETWLAGGVSTAFKYTTIHSDKMHVVERWTREGDEMNYEVTVDDPVMFTKPWVPAPRRVRLAGPATTWETVVQESICSPFDKDLIVPPTDDQVKCPYRCEEGDITIKK